MKYKITFSADFPSGDDIFVEDFVEVLEAEAKLRKLDIYGILNRKLEEKYDNFNDINYEGMRVEKV
ncbi:hypothetical protein [Dapis sp. BLCC M172]|uniref:hypothetical protein n=1 Tax=Dapis sp. BLCC M172 TaxID=2975281 RepID=UPI003CFBA365